MRLILIFTVGILFLFEPTIIFAQKIQDLWVREINYGESKVEKLSETTLKNSPSGHHNTTGAVLKL